MNDTVKMVKQISLFALVMLIVSAIDSIRNMPTTALFGDSMIFFFVLSAITFLIPIALVSAELSSAWTDRGGIFAWVNLAFGEKWGFLAIWLQWINAVVWFPTILSFIAGTAAYLISPALAANKFYLVAVILGTFWVITFINLFGLKTSTQFASICTIFGLAIPVAVIIGLALLWLFEAKPVQLHFTVATMLPSLSHSENWISLTAIITSFLGIELATVHAQQIKNSQHLFPKALFYATIFILITMVAGSLAIALVLPQQQIQLVDGTMQAFTTFFQAYHLSKAVMVLAVLILIGSLGELVNYIISPAKGLQQAAKSGFLPPLFAHQNKKGVAANILIAQAVLVSIFCLAFLLMPSINASYWLLTDLSTEIYVLMYVPMLIAALYLRYKFPQQVRPFKIPGGQWGMWLACCLGLLSCIVTLVIGFFPPDGISVGSTFHYGMIFGSGIVLMIAPIAFFYYYHAKRNPSKLS